MFELVTGPMFAGKTRLLLERLSAAEALGLSREDLVALAKNSFEASFLPPEEKRRWMDAVEAYAARSS